MNKGHWICTIACDVAVSVFGHCEKRRPFSEVVHVEVDVIVLRERVKICEIHFEQVLWLKGAESSHGREMVSDWAVEGLKMIENKTEREKDGGLGTTCR